MRCNRNKLAELFGYDVKTIDKMVKKGMPFVSKPTHGPGRTGWVFDTVEVFNWLTTSDTDRRLRAAKLRIVQAKALLKEVEAALASVEVFHAHEPISLMIEAASVFKSRLVTMPDRLCQLVAVESDPAEVGRMIKDELDDALKAFDIDKMRADFDARFGKRRHNSK